MAPHLTLSDLEGQSQGHSDFDALYLAKDQLHMTLVTFKGLCQGHPGVKSLYLIRELS